MLHLISTGLNKIKADAIVLPVCEDKMLYSKKEVISLIQVAKDLKEFKGCKSDEVILYNVAEVQSKRVIFLGLGKLRLFISSIKLSRLLPTKRGLNCFSSPIVETVCPL